MWEPVLCLKHSIQQYRRKQKLCNTVSFLHKAESSGWEVAPHETEMKSPRLGVIKTGLLAWAVSSTYSTLQWIRERHHFWTQSCRSSLNCRSIHGLMTKYHLWPKRRSYPSSRGRALGQYSRTSQFRSPSSSCSNYATTQSFLQPLSLNFLPDRKNWIAISTASFSSENLRNSNELSHPSTQGTRHHIESDFQAQSSKNHLMTLPNIWMKLCMVWCGAD